jgi:hypothetical protein
MARDHTLEVVSLIEPLARLGRLDPKSSRRLPKQLTTLLRWTVDGLPHELRGTIRGCAPPPTRAPATRYATALVALLASYEELRPGNLAAGIARIRYRLDDLAAVAGQPAPVEAARVRLVEDAFVWRAAQLRRAYQREEHLALVEGHVALVGEGLLPQGSAAMQAAAFLAEHASKLPDYELAARYATLALQWDGGSRGPLFTALADSISILREAGEYERVVELAPPVLARYDVYDELDPQEFPAPEGWAANAVMIGGELTHACLELGQPDQALAHAGHALWRAIRRFGPASDFALHCQLVLSDCLVRAERWHDAVAMIRPAFEAFRARGDEETRTYVYAGIRLAVALGRVGALGEARAVAVEIDALASRRLSRDDQAFCDARSARRHFERFG